MCIRDRTTPLSHDPLVIAGKAYASRLLTGTGKFKDLDETRLATDAAGAQIVTVAIRRTNIGQNPVSYTHLYGYRGQGAGRRRGRPGRSARGG